MTRKRQDGASEAVDPDVAHNLGLDSRGRVRRWAIRVGAVVVVVTMVVLGALAYFRATRPRPIQYQTAAVTRGEVLAGVEATGTVEPLRTVSVGPDVSGRIVAVHADYNDLVREGQVLVEIDPLPFRARQAEARARLSAARAGLRQATATLEDAERRARRFENLAGTGAIAQQELDTARNAVAQGEAAVSNARAQIALAQASLGSTDTDLERTSVRSPVDGVVLERAAEPGQAVAASFQPPTLFVIAEDLTRMELRLAVDEADIGRVEPGQAATFTVDAYPERTFTAEVSSVRNAARTVQGVVTYEVVLAVDNTDRLLRPGMTASARIATARAEDVLLVPNAALRFTPPEHESEGTAVWVLRDGEPTRVEVESGLSDGTLTAVEGALEPGDEVLVDVVPEEP
ncbi:MAG: efflux RND transporter periplasmic adaptor subunit [Sandaracinaceae bacterium]